MPSGALSTRTIFASLFTLSEVWYACVAIWILASGIVRYIVPSSD